VLWVLQKTSVLLAKYLERLTPVKERGGDKRPHCHSCFKDALKKKKKKGKQGK